MKMKYRYLAAILAACLFLFPLAGCKKNKQVAEGGTSAVASAYLADFTGIKPEPADGIGEPGKDFVLLKTAAATDWQDLPVPKFNPLGGYSLYSNVQYNGADGEDITFYTLDGYNEKREIRHGERWELTITDADYSLYWLRWYTREAGGKWYYGTRDHSTFVIQESDTVSWYADARELEDSVSISVLKVNTLPIGKVLTVRPGEIEGNEYYFYTPPN